MLTYAEFSNFDLRVGEIKSAERLGGEVIKVTVDCGSTVTAILDGRFDEKELAGAQVVVLSNLKPTKIHGIEAQGIILTTVDDAGNPILLQPDKKTKPGEKIK